jgi:hypothetical protein
VFFCGYTFRKYKRKEKICGFQEKRQDAWGGARGGRASQKNEEDLSEQLGTELRDVFLQTSNIVLLGLFAAFEELDVAFVVIF